MNSLKNFLDSSDVFLERNSRYILPIGGVAAFLMGGIFVASSFTQGLFQIGKSNEAAVLQAPGPVTVAIIDSGSHGYEVLSAFNYACGSACEGSNPSVRSIFISDLDSNGNQTNESVNDAIIEAVREGANVISVSSGPGCEGDTDPNEADCSLPLTDVELNTSEVVAENNAVLVLAAGNSPTYVQPNSLSDNPYAANTVIVGALDPATSEIAPWSGANANVFTYDITSADTDAWGTSFAAPAFAAYLAMKEVTLGTSNTELAINDAENYTPGVVSATELEQSNGIVTPSELAGDGPSNSDTIVSPSEDGDSFTDFVDSNIDSLVSGTMGDTSINNTDNDAYIGGDPTVASGGGNAGDAGSGSGGSGGGDGFGSYSGTIQGIQYTVTTDPNGTTLTASYTPLGTRIPYTIQYQLPPPTANSPSDDNGDGDGNIGGDTGTGYGGDGGDSGSGDDGASGDDGSGDGGSGTGCTENCDEVPY